MTSLLEEDPTLPLSFNGSTNPEQLQDVTSTDGSLPMVTKMSSGRMSPVVGRTMKEYDQQIADLKKENFSLKLRIFYLEERMQQKLGTGDDVFKTNIELRVQLEGLKKELVDKQDLLQKASNALESISGQHVREIEKIHRTAAEDARENTGGLMEQLEKKVEVLEDKWQHSQQELAQSQKKVANLISLTRKLDSDYRDARRQVMDLQDKLEDEVRSETESEKQCHAKALEERDTMIEQLRKMLKTKDIILEQQEDDKADAVRDLQRQMEREMQELQREDTRKQQDLEMLETKIEELENLCQTHEENAAKRDKAIQGLIGAALERDEKIKDLVEELDGKEQALEQYRTGRPQDNNLPSTPVEDSTAQIEQLKNELENLQMENQNLQSVIRERDGQVSALNEELDKAEQELQQKEGDLQYYSQHVMERVQQERHKAEQRFETLNSQYQGMLEDLQRQLANQETVIQRLTHSLQDKDQQLQQYMNIFQEQDENDKQLSMISSLREQIAEKQKEIEGLMAEQFKSLEEKDREIRQLKQVIRERDQDISRANEMLVNTEAAINTLESEVKEKDQSLQQMESTLEAQDRAVEDLEEKYNEEIDGKESLIKKLQDSLSKKEESLQEATRVSPRSTDERVRQLQQRLDDKEKLLQEMMTDRCRAADTHSEATRELRAKLKEKDALVKNLQQESGSNTGDLNRMIKQLEADLHKKDYELQTLEDRATWAEEEQQEILDKMRDAVKEKDKTVQALVESGQEKDRLLQQMQNGSYNSQTSLATDKLAELQKLKDEVSYLKNERHNKDDLIERLRGALDRRSPKPDIKSKDHVDDPRRGYSSWHDVRSGEHAGDRHDSEEMRRMRQELDRLRDKIGRTSSPQRTHTTVGSDATVQLQQVVQESLREQEKLNEALKTEHDIYLNIKQATQQPPGEQKRALDIELNAVQALRKQLEEAVKRHRETSQDREEKPTEVGVRKESAHPGKFRTESASGSVTELSELDDDEISPHLGESGGLATELQKQVETLRAELEESRRYNTYLQQQLGHQRPGQRRDSFREGRDSRDARDSRDTSSFLQASYLPSFYALPSLDDIVPRDDIVSQMSPEALRGVVQDLTQELKKAHGQNDTLHEAVANAGMENVVCLWQQVDDMHQELKRKEFEIMGLRSTLRQSSPHRDFDPGRRQTLSDIQSELANKEVQLERTENINRLLKKQIELNTKGPDAQKGFSPDLIAEMAQEIERLKEELQKLRQESGKQDKANLPAAATSQKSQIPTLSRSGRPVKADHNLQAQTALQKQMQSLRNELNGAKSDQDASRIEEEDEEEEDEEVQNKLVEGKLISTEATVRRQSEKLKQYRGLLEDAGLMPRKMSKSYSETSLTMLSPQSTEPGRMMLSASTDSLNQRDLSDSSDMLSPSSSLRSINMSQFIDYGQTHDADELRTQVSHLKNHLGKSNRVIRVLQSRLKGSSVETLVLPSPTKEAPRSMTIESRVRNKDTARPAGAAADSAFTRAVQADQHLSHDDVARLVQVHKDERSQLEAQLSDGQNSCLELRQQFENLGDVLDEVLRQDENGQIDLTNITPEKVSQLKQKLAENVRKLNLTSANLEPATDGNADKLEAEYGLRPLDSESSPSTFTRALQKISELEQQMEQLSDGDNLQAHHARALSKIAELEQKLEQQRGHDGRYPSEEQKVAQLEKQLEQVSKGDNIEAHYARALKKIADQEERLDQLTKGDSLHADHARAIKKIAEQEERLDQLAQGESQQAHHARALQKIADQKERLDQLSKGDNFLAGHARALKKITEQEERLDKITQGDNVEADYARALKKIAEQKERLDKLSEGGNIESHYAKALKKIAKQEESLSQLAKGDSQQGHHARALKKIADQKEKLDQLTKGDSLQAHHARALKKIAEQEDRLDKLTKGDNLQADYARTLKKVADQKDRLEQLTKGDSLQADHARALKKITDQEDRLNQLAQGEGQQAHHARALKKIAEQEERLDQLTKGDNLEAHYAKALKKIAEQEERLDQLAQGEGTQAHHARALKKIAEQEERLDQLSKGDNLQAHHARALKKIAEQEERLDQLSKGDNLQAHHARALKKIAEQEERLDQLSKGDNLQAHHARALKKIAEQEERLDQLSKGDNLQAHHARALKKIAEQEERLDQLSKGDNLQAHHARALKKIAEQEERLDQLSKGDNLQAHHARALKKIAEQEERLDQLSKGDSLQADHARALKKIAELEERLDQLTHGAGLQAHHARALKRIGDLEHILEQETGNDSRYPGDQEKIARLEQQLEQLAVGDGLAAQYILALKRIAELEQQVEQLTAGDSLNAHYARALKKISELEQQLDQLTAGTSPEADYARAQQKVADLEDQLRKLAEGDDLQAQYTKALRKISELEQQREHVATGDGLEAHYARALKKTAELEQKLEQQAGDDRRYPSARQTIAALEQKLEQQNQADSMQSRYPSAQQTIADLEQKLGQQAPGDTLQARYGRSQQKITALEQEKDQQKAEVEGLQSRYARAQHRIAQLEQQLQEKPSLDRMESLHATAIADLEQRLKEQDIYLQRLKNELDEKNATIARLQKRLESRPPTGKAMGPHDVHSTAVMNGSIEMARHRIPSEPGSHLPDSLHQIGYDSSVDRTMDGGPSTDRSSTLHRRPNSHDTYSSLPADSIGIHTQDRIKPGRQYGRVALDSTESTRDTVFPDNSRKSFSPDFRRVDNEMPDEGHRLPMEMSRVMYGHDGASHSSSPDRRIGSQGDQDDTFLSSIRSSEPWHEQTTSADFRHGNTVQPRLSPVSGESMSGASQRGGSIDARLTDTSLPGQYRPTDSVFYGNVPSGSQPVLGTQDGMQGDFPTAGQDGYRYSPSKAALLQQRLQSNASHPDQTLQEGQDADVSELERLQSRLDATQELYGYLQKEISLRDQVGVSVGVQNVPQTLALSSQTAGATPLDIEQYLLELRELRQQLERSIDRNDQLRKQLQKELAENRQRGLIGRAGDDLISNEESLRQKINEQENELKDLASEVVRLKDEAVENARKLDNKTRELATTQGELKKFKTEVNRLQQTVTELDNLNRALKQELAMRSNRPSNGTALTGQDGIFDHNALMQELIRLRKQLQKTIENNDLLRQKLQEVKEQYGRTDIDPALLSGSADRLSPLSSSKDRHSPLGLGRPHSGYLPPVTNGLPETDHSETTTVPETKRIKRQLFGKSLAGEPMNGHGVERLSGAPSAGHTPPQRDRTPPHTQAVMDQPMRYNALDNTYPPDSLTGNDQEGVSDDVRADATEVRVCSDLRTLYAIGKLDDYELLRRQLGEMNIYLLGLDERMQERLQHFEDLPVTQSTDYILLRQLKSSSTSLVHLSHESRRLVDLFWTSQLPRTDQQGNFLCDVNLVQENENLKDRLAKLQGSYKKAMGKLDVIANKQQKHNERKEAQLQIYANSLKETYDMLKKSNQNFERKLGPIAVLDSQASVP